MDTFAWASWIVGGVLAVVGLGIALWAVWGDRSRGRRRCPKCWYDMSKVPGMTCPECGRAPKTERRFAGTRRRWKGMLLAGAMVMLGMAAAVTPAVYTGKWVKYTPRPILSYVVARFPNDAREAYEKAIQSNNAAAVATQSSWQKLLIASECGKKLAAWRAVAPNVSEKELSQYWYFRQRGAMFSFGSPTPEENSRSPIAQAYVEADSAVTVVASLGDESCVAWPELLQLLKSGHQSSAQFAMDALAALKGSAEPLAPALCKIVRSGDTPESRICAAIAVVMVVSSPSRATSRMLLAAAESDESPDVRAVCIRCIASLDPGNPEVVPMLVRCITTDESPTVRLRALGTIEKFFQLEQPGDQSPANGLGISSRWYPSGNIVSWDIRYVPDPSAARLKPDTRFIDTCANALIDDTPKIRTIAATYLDQIGTPAHSALPAIDAAIIKETDSEARRALMQAFLHIEAGPRAVQILTESLNDPSLSESTVRWAFTELGRLGNAAASAIPTIERFIATHDFTLVFAVETLAQIGKAGLPKLLRLLQDPRDGVRIMASSAMVRESLETCGITDELLAHVSDTCPSVRVYVAKTLAKCPARWAAIFPAIAGALRTEPSYSARMELIEIVASYGSDHPAELAPLLAEFLKDEIWSVRLVATQQLARFATFSAVALDAIKAAQHDPDESVRAAANEAIRTIDGK